MTRPLYLGIDTGGTTAKAALFDDRGTELAVAGLPLAAMHPCPGYTERDMQQMWDATAGAVRTVVGLAGARAADITAVCCTGHGNGIYLLDKSGEPVGHGIVSSDTRTHQLARDYAARPEAARICALLGQQYRASTPLLLFAWLDAHRPALSKATAHALLCKDYVRFRLNGRMESDSGDLSGSALLNLATGDYDDEVFNTLKLGHWRDRLPPVRRNSALCGTVTRMAAAETGLAEGTPVVAGMMDLDAATLASGVLDGTQAVICAGTWSINVVVLEQPCSGRLPLMQALHRDSTRVIACEGSPTSATNLSWLLRNVLPDVEYAAADLLVESLQPQDSHLIYLPFIHGGLGAPQAAFIGLGQGSGQADLLRAVYEGVVFSHHEHVADLIAVTGCRVETVRLSGGASRSAAWAQMFADVLGRTIEIAEGSELGALGCAICAAVATGRYGGFEEAVTAMTRVGRRFHPHSGRTALYAEKHDAYVRVRKALDPAWCALGRARPSDIVPEPTNTQGGRQ